MQTCQNYHGNQIVNEKIFAIRTKGNKKKNKNENMNKQNQEDEKRSNSTIATAFQPHVVLHDSANAAAPAIQGSIVINLQSLFKL